MLPPAGVPELATKADLVLLRSDLTAERRSLGAALSAEIAEARADVAVRRAEVGEAIQRAMREQITRVIGWILGMLGIGLGATGAIAGLR